MLFSTATTTVAAIAVAGALSGFALSDTGLVQLDPPDSAGFVLSDSSFMQSLPFTGGAHPVWRRHREGREAGLEPARAQRILRGGLAPTALASAPLLPDPLLPTPQHAEASKVQDASFQR